MGDERARSLQAPVPGPHDIAVLLTTFGLTIFADLTIAVGVGMVLASMLFMKRMSDVTGVGAIVGDDDDELQQETRDDLNGAVRSQFTPTPRAAQERGSL